MNYDNTSRKLEILANGYATPFWVKEIIKTMQEKNIVDVANWLGTLSQLADQRAKAAFADVA